MVILTKEIRPCLPAEDIISEKVCNAAINETTLCRILSNFQTKLHIKPFLLLHNAQLFDNLHCDVFKIHTCKYIRLCLVVCVHPICIDDSE